MVLMIDDQLLSFLQHVASESVSSLHRNGYNHLSLILLPRLKMAGNNKLFKTETLANCWAKVAGIYEMNRAPLRAEMAFKKALLLHPGNIAVMQKIIDVQIQTGRYNEAFINVNNALDIDTDNMLLYTKRQAIQDDMNYQSEPLYRENDFLWSLNENLANNKFDFVINKVLDSDMNDIEKLKCLARAYGALAHHANYLNVWNTIFELDDKVLFEPADWFFLPVELRESEEMRKVLGDD